MWIRHAHLKLEDACRYNTYICILSYRPVRLPSKGGQDHGVYTLYNPFRRYNCSGSTQFQLNVNLNLELEHGKSHKVRNMSLFFFFFVSAEYIHTSFLSKKQQFKATMSFQIKKHGHLVSHGYPREGLWLVELDKFCSQKMLKFIIFENAPN